MLIRFISFSLEKMNDSNVFKFERRTPPPPPPEDFDTQRALETCEEMLAILSDHTVGFSIATACSTHFFVHLHDLAQRAKTIGKPLVFTDDVDIINDVTNITDLISKLRNAVCHIRSRSRNMGEGTFVFTRIVGYAPRAIVSKEHVQGCNYPDDTALYYGAYRFYLSRHGTRAIKELRLIFAGKP